jgi:hypothetical protein
VSEAEEQARLEEEDRLRRVADQRAFEVKRLEEEYASLTDEEVVSTLGFDAGSRHRSHRDDHAADRRDREAREAARVDREADLGSGLSDRRPPRGDRGSGRRHTRRRTIGYGPRTADVLDEQYQSSRYRSPESLLFCHPALGTPLDPSKVSRYMRKAISAAGIERTIRPWHDLRHTALTHDAAAGNPAVYVQARAGHAQATMTERYVHAAQVAFPGAAERAEDRIFGGVAHSPKAIHG